MRAALLAGVLLAGAAPTAAAAPDGRPVPCRTAGGTVTCTADSPGRWVWRVPAGVREVRASVQGAAGGSSPLADGGRGGSLSGVVDVTQGQILGLVVGGAGIVSVAPHWGRGGGFNGGGQRGGGGAAGGGGASDIRLGPGPGDRVLVAGGGGGAGAGPGAHGGDGGGLFAGPGLPLGAGGPPGGPHSGGSTLTSPLGPMTLGPVYQRSAPTDGAFGRGGPGASTWTAPTAGGGGGGGWYGGAGGSEQAVVTGAGGGGGGSGYAAPAVREVRSGSPADGEGRIVLTYELP